jgi:hypothetical protein
MIHRAEATVTFLVENSNIELRCIKLHLNKPLTSYPEAGKNQKI